MIRLVAFHFSSGDAFFSGIGLLLLACLIGAFLAERRRCIGRTIGLVGCLMIAFSATPFAIWFYAVWAVVTAAWFTALARGDAARRKRQRFATAALVLCSLIAAGWELTFRFPRKPATSPATPLYVLGDSLASGMQESADEPTWPKQLQTRFGVEIVDLSHVGATTRMARKQALGIDRTQCVVLIEVGGNDLLGDTTVAQFSRDLEELLNRLRRPGRALVMLELPLPPFYNRFGQVQRDLARRFDVVLIPKREFAAAIFARGSTLDGLHFSEQGHTQMAGRIWNYIHPFVLRTQ